MGLNNSQAVAVKTKRHDIDISEQRAKTWQHSVPFHLHENAATTAHSRVTSQHKGELAICSIATLKSMKNK